MSANNSKNALDVLMNHARNDSSRKRPISYVPCPSCGAQVAERDVNDHLDRCLINSNSNDGSATAAAVTSASSMPQDNAAAIDSCAADTISTSTKGSATKRQRAARTPSPQRYSTAANSNTPAADTPNAFSHMMKRSATVFSKSENDENVIRHRFHLHNHNADGFVTTWTSDSEDEVADTSDGRSTKKMNEAVADDVKAKSPSPQKKYPDSVSVVSAEEVHWSATTTMKKLKIINVDSPLEQQTSIDDNDKSLELTISSSVPFPQGDKGQRLVRRHSRLSVSHLKSCLQKSIRRRQPLPAVRVAMELADKSWGDLIRRLPIIVLEDSTLHPDFGLLVWLMVAESKGYFPCMPLLKRVMQIVFEIASCPRQDTLSESESFGESVGKLPLTLSLKTPTSQLFPDQHTKDVSINGCEVFIRSMLLRAQYGGMKCDVQMLQSFAALWLKRFQSMHVPTSLASTFAPESAMQPIYDFPRILHEKAHEKSKELVSSTTVCPGGLLKLNHSDVCSAGIDFHCSSVVEYLLSQPGVYTSLAQLNIVNEVANRDWISGQLKSMIWHFSSGINNRRALVGADKKNMEDSSSKVVWKDVVKSPFEGYTKKFVRDRLS